MAILMIAESQATWLSADFIQYNEESFDGRFT